MRTAAAFLKRDYLIATSYRVAFIVQLFGIVMMVPVFYFMGRMVPTAAEGHLDRYGGSYFAFLLIGVAFMDYLAISLRTFNESIRESQLMGTLEIVLLSPTALWQVLIYSSLWIYLLTTFRFLLYLAMGLVFGLNLSNANAPAAVLVLALAVPAFASLGILSASVTMLIKRGDSINVALSTASLALGGVLFPLSVMPHWLQQAGKLLPVTHALEAMRRALLGGAGMADLLPQLSVLILFTLVLFPFSMLCFHSAVRASKRSGALAQY